MRKNLYNLWLIITCLCLILTTFFLWSIAARLGTLDSFVYLNLEQIDKEEKEVSLRVDPMFSRVMNH